jgi:imidazolonepropionase-like amidohydrolase
MADQAVPVLAGTDFPNPMLIPGQSLHQELEYLVNSGYSNLEALKAATLYPANYWGDPKAGVIEPNSKANFVLMKENPLEKISNSLSIYTTVQNGILYKRDELID